MSTQVQVDAAKTALDVAERTLAAMQLRPRRRRPADERRRRARAGRRPHADRAVSEGSVVLPGETIATLAEDRYILRLQLPERHARFMRAGDVVQIGARGLEDDGRPSARARVRLVYPEIEGGRVIADVEVPGLGDYFVGERTRVYVSTGVRARDHRAARLCLPPRRRRLRQARRRRRRSWSSSASRARIRTSRFSPA